MTNKTLPMTGQLYRVANAIKAEPGQYVIVVADIVIGVYTGDQHVPVAQAKPNTYQERIQSTPATVDPPVRKSSTYQYTSHTRPYPSYSLRPVVESIRAHLLVHPIITPKELSAVTGLDRQNWAMRDAIRWMQHHGYLTTTGGTKDRRYHATDKTKQPIPAEPRKDAA